MNQIPRAEKAVIRKMIETGYILMKNDQDCSSGSDRISNLPDKVIYNILSRMPLRDAMKTSMLSKTWRYKWLHLSKLVFDETFGQVQAGSETNLLSAMFKVLSVHRGELLNFTLSVPGLKSCPEMDILTLTLSNKNVQELEFYVSDGNSILYKMPSSLFSCMHLRILKLKGCILNPPPTFTRFNELVCVEFCDLEFTANHHAIEIFISKCPLLERLILDRCSNTQQLEIDAPNLKFFTFVGELVSISFKNAPVLAAVSLHGVAEGDQAEISSGETSNLVKTFISLPAIEHLHVGWRFLLFLSAGEIPERLPTILEFLTVLEFHHICFGNPKELRVALCLIRSSPNLRKLRIQFYSEEESLCNNKRVDLEDQYPLHDCNLQQLQEVELTNFNGTKYELEMVRLILARSLTLKKMVIEPREGIVAAEYLKVLNQVTQFKRVSPDAEIFMDPQEMLLSTKNGWHWLLYKSLRLLLEWNLQRQ